MKQMHRRKRGLRKAAIHAGRQRTYTSRVSHVTLSRDFHFGKNFTESKKYISEIFLNKQEKKTTLQDRVTTYCT